jgi:hypothetical protein
MIATPEMLEQHNLPADNFGYSAARITDLGASEYTLVTIVCDVSGSVDGFRREMEKALKEIVKACRYSPRADNLMLRLLTFSNLMGEVHGFKPLPECKEDDYGGCLNTGGSTALFDATANAVSATHDYGKRLAASDFSTNAIVVVITDGMDNASAQGAVSVKKVLARAVNDEALESMVSILIGVNMAEQAVADALDKFRQEAGLTQFVALADASYKTLAKLAQFVSKSISSQSQALGTGGPSKPLTF